MKLGKLIISSNLTVLKEILVDKKNCLLINNYKVNMNGKKQFHQ